MDITELPIRKWTQDYKEFLEGLIKPEDKNEAASLIEYREHHGDTGIHFELQMAPAKMQEALSAGLMTKFKLTSKMSIGTSLGGSEGGGVQGGLLLQCSNQHLKYEFVD